jgi:hydrogenase/urease accessory protein HupE
MTPRSMRQAGTVPRSPVRRSVPAPPLLCAVLLAALAGVRGAEAHPVPFSYLDLRLKAGVLEGSVTVHVFDLAHDLDIQPAERLLDPAFAAERATAVHDLLAGRFGISADGRELEPQWSSPELLAGRNSLRLPVGYALAGRPGTLRIHAAMFPYDPQHQTFLNIYEDEALTQVMLGGDHREFEYFPGTRQGASAVVRKFLAAGVHHILIGPDHLLFLVGLLLLGGSVRQLAVIVTAFTAAHSITLSLAALNLVGPPARLIEPAIALSIVYVGADTLLKRDGRDVRGWIAFAFGFIHGFGFASVLREMGLPARALGLSLVSFNAGIEIGQLLVVAFVATALSALRSHNETAGRRLAFAGSVVVMAAGAFWFVQRVFFPGGVS